MTFHSDRIHAITLKSNGFEQTERNKTKQRQNKRDEKKTHQNYIVVSILSPAVYTPVRIDWFANLQQHFSIPTYALIRTFLFTLFLSVPLFIFQYGKKNERKDPNQHLVKYTAQKNKYRKKERASWSNKQ